MLIFLTDIKTMEEYTFLAPLLLTIGGLIIGANTEILAQTQPPALHGGAFTVPPPPINHIDTIS